MPRSQIALENLKEARRIVAGLQTMVDNKSHEYKLITDSLQDHKSCRVFSDVRAKVQHSWKPETIATLRESVREKTADKKRNSLRKR